MKLSLIAALAENRVIGQGGRLPWHLPEDLRRFRRLTLGKVLIMGRKTFTSIGRPLPERVSVVISSRPGVDSEQVRYVSSPAQAVETAGALLAAGGRGDEVMVIGGGQIYAHFLPLATCQYLTLVKGRPEGDAFYPEYDPADWQCEREAGPDGLVYLTLRREAPDLETTVGRLRGEVRVGPG